MNNQEKVFSFYLDESVWFKEGQGVRELIGISLEPEITIEERGNEVCLKGTVQLAGEYLAIEEQQEVEESFNSSQRVVDDVEVGEEGEYRFSHAFPVEVTVPFERVTSLDQVFVDIETFDYEIPANNQMRLHAQVNINGIEPQSNQQAENEERFDQQATIGPFDFPENTIKEEPLIPEREAPVVQLNNDEEQDDESGRWLYKKSQSFSEFFGHEKQEEETLEVSSSEDVSIEETSQESTPESSSSKESEEQEAPSGMDGIKQIFKHLFPNREDTYTQMKMYIAQEQETLESIAEKYDVSVKQLERVNRSDAEEVSPGEIVYIPN